MRRCGSRESRLLFIVAIFSPTSSWKNSLISTFAKGTMLAATASPPVSPRSQRSCHRHKAGRHRSGAYDFANVDLEPRHFPKSSRPKKVSFVPILDRLASRRGRSAVSCSTSVNGSISDRAPNTLKIHQVISRRPWRPAYLHREEWPASVAADAQVAGTACLNGFYAVGSGCLVEGSTVIEDSILWERATVRTGSILRSCVVAGSLVISGRQER